MTINETIAKLHAEAVTARFDALVAPFHAAKASGSQPANVVDACLAAAKAVADDLINNPMQIIDGTTAVTANPASFTRAMASAAKAAGIAAMKA